MSAMQQLSTQEVAVRRLREMLHAAIERATKAEAEAAEWRARWEAERRDHEATIKHHDEHYGWDLGDWS